MLFSARSLAFLLTATTVASNVSEAANIRQRSLQTYTPSDDYFSVMLDRVNQERAAQGLPALCTNKKLQAAAQEHSNDQAANNYMDHTGTDGSTIADRISKAGFDWTAVAENVAAGQVDVDAVMESWMNSPGHRENILGDYTMFGTAYAYNADSEFKHYWTQDFGSGDAEECDDVTTNSDGSEGLVSTLIESVAFEADPAVESSSSGSNEQTTQTLFDPVVAESDAPAATTETETTPPVVIDPPEIGTPCPETSAPTAINDTATPCPKTDTPTSTAPVVVVDPPELSYQDATQETYSTAYTPTPASKTYRSSKKDCRSRL